MEGKLTKRFRYIKNIFYNQLNDSEREDNPKRGFTLTGSKDHGSIFRLRREQPHKAAFTLIELIVVMAVIAILVLLAAPKFLGYTQKAEETKYIHTAKVIETALDAYLINGGEIGDGLTIVDNTILTESVANKNLFNTKGYMVSMDTNTYYELTDDFIKANLDIKLSASKSTPFVIEAHAAKSSKIPNAVYATSDGAVIINKEQTLKGYVSPSAGDDTVIDDNPIGGDTETPAEETPPIPNYTTDATLREYFTFDALTGTITAYSLTGPKDVVIPFEIDGVAVTTIGNYAFQAKGLTSVIIPESVTSIGNYAFYNNSLKSLVIPDSVTTISTYAFRTNLLTSIVIPDTVTSMSGNGFSLNPINMVQIGANKTVTTDFPNNFITGYDSYFKTAGTYRYNSTSKIWSKDNCDASYILNKTSGTITTYIGTAKDVVIPDKIIMDGVAYQVTAIGGDVFINKGLTSVIIPESVISIGSYAFYNNSLKSLVIPDSVTTISTNAFRTNLLTSIVIPDTVTSISATSFSLNPINMVQIGANKTVTTDFPNNFTSGYDNYFKTAGTYRYNSTSRIWSKDNCDASFILNKTTGAITTYLGTVKDIVIPDKVIMDGVAYPVLSIGAKAFESKGFTSVVIPDSVTSIGSYAFYNNSLKSLVIPNSVTTISAYAFRTNLLTSVVVSDAVTSIGPDAFRYNGPSKNSGTFTAIGQKTWTLTGTETIWK